METTRVLLVDDDIIQYELVKAYLEEADGSFELMWAESCAGARNFLQERQPDVCLLDYMLEDGLGLEVVHWARETGLTVPFVLLTGMETRRLDHEASAAGVAEYLVKGNITPDSLARTLRYTRRQAEVLAERSRSEARFRSLFELSHDAILLHNKSGIIQEVNRQACLLFDGNAEELIGRSVASLCVPHKQADAEQAVRKITASGHGRLQTEVETLSGRILQVDISAGVINAEEQVYQTILRDVTELNRLSRERDMYYQALQRSAHSVLLLDLSGRIAHVNQAAEELTGYSADALLGRPADFFDPGPGICADLGIDQDAYRKMRHELGTTIRSPRAASWVGELPLCCRGGAIVWVHLLVRAIQDGAGETNGYFAMAIDITERREQEFSIRLECYRALTELAETRDNETGAHLTRMSLYACALAEELGTSKRYAEDIAIFSPLHDIGKVGIEDRILLAPRRLTDEEFEIMKTHSRLGYDILAGRPTLEMAADIALNHHERWDGLGYPQGLAGEDIPLSARIVALADVYDALRSKRPYKEPWSHSDTRAEIIRCRGKHFDPAVVDAFLKLEDHFRRIAGERTEEIVLADHPLTADIRR